MVMLRALLGAVIGGAIGAGIWAAITVSTGYEIGWIAWGVGVLVGGGAMALSRGEASSTTGAIAALVALAAVGVGKYAAVVLTVDDLIKNSALSHKHYSDSDMLVVMATDVAAEWEENGKKLKWPEGMSNEDAQEELDFPKDVWREGRKRWEAMSNGEKEDRRAEAEAALAQMTQTLRAEVVGVGFSSSFSMFDVLFFGLAVASAYRIGAGGGGDD